MPVTVHKVLVHSAEVIKTWILVIGQLSEKSQETRNKDFRRLLEQHTRRKKCISTNIGLLHILLSFDPVINSRREVFQFFNIKNSKLLNYQKLRNYSIKKQNIGHHNQRNHIVE